MIRFASGFTAKPTKLGFCAQYIRNNKGQFVSERSLTRVQRTCLYVALAKARLAR